jgi:hypothetical protein
MYVEFDPAKPNEHGGYTAPAAIPAPAQWAFHLGKFLTEGCGHMATSATFWTCPVFFNLMISIPGALHEQEQMIRARQRNGYWWELTDDDLDRLMRK